MEHADYLKAFEQYINYAEATGCKWFSFDIWKSMYMGRHQGIYH